MKLYVPVIVIGENGLGAQIFCADSNTAPPVHGIGATKSKALFNLQFAASALVNLGWAPTPGLSVRAPGCGSIASSNSPIRRIGLWKERI